MLNDLRSMLSNLLMNELEQAYLFNKHNKPAKFFLTFPDEQLEASVEITSGYETKGYLGSNERNTKICSYENYIGVHKDHVKIYKME